MDAIRDEFIPDSRTGNGGIWRLFALLFGLGLLLVGYLFMQRGNELKQTSEQLALVQDTCQSVQKRLNDRLELLQQLTVPQNKILPFTATPGFTSTDIYLHTNTATKRNFIQVRNLPAIADNQSYELWSIKPDSAPAPLDVFDTPAGGLIEVQYVEGTAVYAITIEPKGGVQSPTMANLIGTVAVGGN